MNNQEQLVHDEQIILDGLIKEMDSVLLRLKKGLTQKQLDFEKQKSKCLPDTYGALIQDIEDKKWIRSRYNSFRQSRDELYYARLVLSPSDAPDKPEDLKIGLHTFTDDGEIFIISWVREACRNFMLNDSLLEDDCEVTDKHGNRYQTHYTLKLRRNVDLFFDTVNGVTHLYPLSEGEEKVIADEFLKQLLERRGEEEFRNIVFSIQRQQGEIIQTPYQKNMIVQGCAGSGKSMIMLHRLPIILYDNPQSLERNSLYTITPSVAYIQMMEKMREDLEIEDLQMGTVEQYFDYVIRKYNRDAKGYTGFLSYLRTSPECEKYLYSSSCKDDIARLINEAIIKGEVNLTDSYAVFGEVPVEISSVVPLQKIRSWEVAIQYIISKNNVSLRECHRTLRSIVRNALEIVRWFSGRRLAVSQSINKRISEEEKRIVDARKKLLTLDANENKKDIDKLIDVIEQAQRHITEYKDDREKAAEDTAYFEKLRLIGEKGKRILGRWEVILSEREKIEDSILCKAFDSRMSLYIDLRQFLEDVSLVEEKYTGYTAGILGDVFKILNSLENLKSREWKYLPISLLEELSKSKVYYESLRESIVDSVYGKVMDRLGYQKKENGERLTPSFTPYLYLQILNLYQGAPNAKIETLITIDEAQTISIEELKLIKSVNRDKVILNLFGDEKQHIEGSRGINSWEEVEDIADFQRYDMQENYRNARQITEYCNDRFHLHMRAINISGAGVHVATNERQFIDTLTEVFQKPLNPGLSGIIVKDAEEAKTFLNQFHQSSQLIQDMTSDVVELDKNKWNLLPIEQAKGLEFSTVIAVSGRMSTNEKYIAYTRALDELYVYDLPITLVHGQRQEPVLVSEAGSPSTNKRPRRLKSTFADIGVKEFFEAEGLEVLDDRKRTGFLWVFGEKEEIKDYIDRATAKYNISGVYGSSKSTGFRAGWYTKTKK